MGTIIDEIREKMTRFPGARVKYDESSITYFPKSADGFVVRLVVDKTGPNREKYSVYYNGLHQEFTHRGTAVEMFGIGLSNGIRLREFSRGCQNYRWILDFDNVLHWKPDWEIVRFSSAYWQFWRTPLVHVLQNRLIDLSAGGEPDAMAGAMVPRPPGGGLPSLSAANEIPREQKNPEQGFGGYQPPPAPC